MISLSAVCSDPRQHNVLLGKTLFECEVYIFIYRLYSLLVLKYLQGLLWDSVQSITNIITTSLRRAPSFTFALMVITTHFHRNICLFQKSVGCPCQDGLKCQQKGTTTLPITGIPVPQMKCEPPPSVRPPVWPPVLPPVRPHLVKPR